jgi:cyanuric acid amidohydrolase
VVEVVAMSAASVIRVMTSRPDDVSALAEIPAELLAGVQAVAGKTEGNGGVNDFTRALAARAWHDAFPQPIVTVMSGGTEGVLSPHVTLLGTRADEPDAPPGGLAIGTAISTVIGPTDLGRRAQVDAVAIAVAAACRSAGFEPSAAEFVLVKCPLLTSDDIAAGGDALVTSDTYKSMAYSRAASALGAALAIGEVDDDGVASALAGDGSVWSSVTSTSAGAEVAACHVVVLGPSADVRSRLRASHAVMADAIDAAPVRALLDEIDEAGGRVVQLFAKAEASPDGAVRGRRHTMLTDSDVNATRHARAAVAGLLAGLTGETAIYVSGGAEHQGPPGGGPVTIVWELP